MLGGYYSELSAQTIIRGKETKKLLIRFEQDYLPIVPTGAFPIKFDGYPSRILYSVSQQAEKRAQLSLGRLVGWLRKCISVPHGFQALPVKYSAHGRNTVICSHSTTL